MMAGASTGKLALAALGLVLLACEDVRFTPSGLQVDVFEQAPLPVVDILWVVDNSGTMREERQQLGEKFDQFMSELEKVGADYHIGIVSTDTDDPTHSGRLQGSPKIIGNDTADPKATFIANVDLPETSNRNEKGLEAMRLALSDELLAGDNAGFLREQASLYVIVLSDEDDHSLGPTRYYARWLEHLKGKGEENRVSLSALVGQAPSGCEGAQAGARYLEVQQLTGGLFYSICENDYGPVVKALGIEAAGMRRKFVLSEVPLVDTLRVLVAAAGAAACSAPEDCSAGLVCAASSHCAEELDSAGGRWVYEPGDNAVFFPGEYLPPAGSSIEVAYKRGVR